MKRQEHEPTAEYKDANGKIINIGSLVRLSEAGREFYKSGGHTLAIGPTEYSAEGYLSEKVSVEYRGKVIGFLTNSRVQVLNEVFEGNQKSEFWADRIRSVFLIVE